MSTTERLHIYLFGSFRLLRNEAEIAAKDWHTRQARQLFKVLLQEKTRLVSSRRLIALLWPENVEHAHKALRSAVSALRDVLEPTREPWLSSSFVPRGRGGYALVFPPVCRTWIDTVEFERLLDQGLQGVNTRENRALLEQALQLYTDDYLAEDAEALWVLAERARLRERYFAGVTRLMQWQSERAHYHEAIAAGHCALRLDVCREPLYRLIMQYQARAGDTASALQTFELCRLVLADALGADPSAQTLGLHMAILDGTFLAPAHRETGAAVDILPEAVCAAEPCELELRANVAQEQALRYTMQAADYARRAYSYRQALVDYDAASRLLQVQEARQGRIETLSSEWWGSLYHGRGLVYEALQDWQGLQENAHELLAWAEKRQDPLLVHGSLQRLIVNRALMGHLSESLSMGRAFIRHLQHESARLPAHNARTRESLRLLVDLGGRWENLLSLDDPADNCQEPVAPFPLFKEASLPGVHDWEQVSELLGPSQAAFLLTSYGWALLLQGLSAETEACLRAAQRAAQATGQATSEILALLHLSQAYYRSEQHERGQQEFARCMQRCEQVREARWVVIWPLLNQAYYMMALGRLDEAGQLFVRVERRLEGLDLPSYRSSLRIGLGLLALARHQFDAAGELLHSALTHKQGAYIEVYVLAEIGLAHIAEQRGAYSEARTRLHRMLAFTGRRSLLLLYATSALAFVRLGLRTRERQGLAELLARVYHMVSAAGASSLADRCLELQAYMS
ncbi:MAG TPA: BTAD domain-containing putative transcriptional regulator [Ktedonobacteraceae bacterium]|jgi:DNA-binding SARP family transcriptional activator